MLKHWTPAEDAAHPEITTARDYLTGTWQALIRTYGSIKVINALYCVYDLAYLLPYSISMFTW